MNSSNKITNFYTRWNMDIDEKIKFHQFKNRTLNSIADVLNYDNCFLRIAAR